MTVPAERIGSGVLSRDGAFDSRRGHHVGRVQCAAPTCRRWLPANDRCRLPRGEKAHAACLMRLQLSGRVVPMRGRRAR